MGYAIAHLNPTMASAGIAPEEHPRGQRAGRGTSGPGALCGAGDLYAT